MKKIKFDEGNIKYFDLTEEEEYLINFHKNEIESKEKAYEFIKNHSISLSQNEGIVQVLEEIWEDLGDEFIPQESFIGSVEKKIIEFRLLGMGDLLSSLKRLAISRYYLQEAKYEYAKLKKELNIVEER